MSDNEDELGSKHEPGKEDEPGSGDEVEGAAKPEGEPKLDDRPEYMKEERPKGKTSYIKWALLRGKMEDELVSEGSNPRSVDICAQELEKAGLRKRLPKGRPGTELTPTGKQGIQIFAKGSPPEALIESMAFPLVDGETKGFEHGMKFGASIVVLGVRIAQELSGIGIQQARPLVEMARDMRSGEAAAAKNAAAEAAMLAAAQIQQNLAPLLAGLGRAQETDPMKSMMVRTMEPLFKNMLSRIMPGMASGDPAGWSRRQE